MRTIHFGDLGATRCERPSDMSEGNTRHVRSTDGTCTKQIRKKAATNICRPRVSNFKEKDMKDEPALRTAPAGYGGPHLWREAFSACHGTKNGARNKKPPSRRQKQDARQGSTAARPQGHFAKRL